MPDALQCTNCNGYSTVTRYSHVTSAGELHDFDIQNPPPPTPLGTPKPQPCPIDGCYAPAGDPPGPNSPPPANTTGDPIFSYCLDCGLIMPA